VLEKLFSAPFLFLFLSRVVCLLLASRSQEAKRMSSSDLFEVQNYFILGNYQAAINEANKLQKLSDSVRMDRDVLLYESYIAQRKYQIVLEEIKDTDPIPLQSVRLLATYFSGDGEDSKEMVMKKLKEWLNKDTWNYYALHQVATIIYSNEGNYENAKNHAFTDILEGLAVIVHLYLKINRVDLAEKELKFMQQKDDDATLTQLASAWIALAVGGEKVQEALVIFQELLEKSGATSMLLNGIAVCNMHMKQFTEAEKSLLQALEKDPNDGNTIANLIVCYQHTGKSSELIARQISQLRNISPKHPWLIDALKVESSFDRLAESFATYS